MKIRLAKKEDLKEIAKIFRAEIVKPPYNEKRQAGKSLERIKEFFKKKKIYVAELEKELAGFIVISQDPDYPKKIYVDEFWLRKKYQRRGIGKALIEYVEETYKKKGAKIIKLVSHKDSEAFKFYKKIKFKESRRTFMEKKI